MNLPNAPKPIKVHSDSRGEISTQLSGHRLVLARVLWVTLVILTLTAFLIIFPQYTALETAEAHQKFSSSGGYVAYTIILTVASMLMCLAVAVVIFWHKSSDWRALLVALMLVMIGTTVVTNAVQEPNSPWEIPALILNTLAFGALFLVFSLFPDGQFVPHWIAWLPVVWILWGIVFTVFRSIPHPIHTLIWLCALIILVVAQVYRFRYVSGPKQRQQTKWVVFGVSVAIVVVIGLVVPQLLFPSLLQTGSFYQLITTLGYTCALLIGSLSFAIAILHSRLWDIDVLINRTLVYGSLTGTLALVYFGSIIVLQALVRGLTGNASQSPLVIVVSTLAIAALFGPLRRRIQAIIDRRFYRRKYDAARTLAEFSATLHTEVDLDDLSRRLVSVVEETMQPSYISLWLRKPQREIKHTAWDSTPLRSPHEK